MNSHYPSEEEIFENALQLADEARASYLNKTCGADEPLRRRIEQLLQAHERAGEILDKPPVAVPAMTLVMTTGMIPVTEKPGDRIGRYKLLQQIGEGGCGVVYMAEQEEPVRRRVALKVIKLGMDTKSVIARFEAERQALALMDHPNIARVLDAGATETGRPFFVMELVRGIRITDYCDQNNLSTAQRLDLFVQVCQAIQHAHQKGIIHRDIKPSNILVADHDGVPVPKVIDFGIAKATTDQRLTDKTLFTAFEQFIGTPAYMSPEQAKLSGLDIDTRSDIYSLGVLLYELLTGQTPFDAATLLQAGLDQMRRIIREEEPPRPSTRLSTMAAADLTTVSHCRHAEPLKLINSIRDDLDWVVMKCLEKDRMRRYETVNALAVDVKRHLDNEPVIARPPSPMYRFQKLVRRNKVAFATSAAVTVLVIVGLSVSISLLRKEQQARQQANAAEEGQNQAREEAKAYLLTQQADDVDYNEEEDRIPLYREALAIRRKLLGNEHLDVASSLDNLADTVSGQEAEACFRESLAIRRRLLGDEHPDTVCSIDRLARVLANQARWAEAEFLYRESFAARRKLSGGPIRPILAPPIAQLGRVLTEQAKLSEAEIHYRESIAIERQDASARKNVPHLLDLLAQVLRRQGKLQEAENTYREALAARIQLYGKGDLRVATSLRNLASVLRDQGNSPEADIAYRDAVAIETRHVSDGNPEVTDHLESIAYELAARKNYEEAEAVFNESLAIVNETQPNRDSLLLVRGNFRVSIGHWKDAAADLSIVAKLHPEDFWSSYLLAPVLVKSGDLGHYREHCQRMLTTFGSKDAGRFVQEKAGMVCLLLPGETNLAPAIEVVNSSTSGKTADWALATKGLADYRGGHYANVMKWAEAVVRVLDDPNSSIGDHVAWAGAVLAMAHHQLNNTNEARAVLTKSIEKGWHWKFDGEQIDANFMGKMVMTQILLDEARSLIENKPATSESAK